MTVCIAARCNRGRGVVVASDTMVTNPGIPIEFEHKESKISLLSSTCVAMTAGNALAYTELFGVVRNDLAELREPSIRQIVEAIKERYKDLRQKLIREQVLCPRGLSDLDHFHKIQCHLNPEFVFGVQGNIDRYDYGLEIILAGGVGETQIYGVVNPGTAYCFDAIGFHAIGSGTTHALNAMIARECYAGKCLLETLMIVYEAKRLAQKAPGVGVVTDIAVLEEDRFLAIPRQEIQSIEPIYQRWVRHDPSWMDELRALWATWMPRENIQNEQNNAEQAA
jgi:ATP-dependent protease HslVU (ClpYQ) peptidase subunit